MSEPKRVTFETISSGSSKNSTDARPKLEKTVRLELKLFEPNSQSFPQFNFKKLCRVEKVIKPSLLTERKKERKMCVFVQTVKVHEFNTIRS